MENLFVALKYGAIGLGAILAVLAYCLLGKEQEVTRPRRQVFIAIYGFMIFSLALVVGGLATELWKSEIKQTSDADAKTIADLKIEVGKKSTEIEKLTDNLKTSNDALTSANGNAKTAHEILGTLLALKEGKIDQLHTLQPGTPEYHKMVSSIHDDLVAIDKQIRAKVKLK